MFAASLGEAPRGTSPPPPPQAGLSTSPMATTSARSRVLSLFLFVPHPGLAPSCPASVPRLLSPSRWPKSAWDVLSQGTALLCSRTLHGSPLPQVLWRLRRPCELCPVSAPSPPCPHLLPLYPGHLATIFQACLTSGSDLPKGCPLCVEHSGPR